LEVSVCLYLSRELQGLAVMSDLPTTKSDAEAEAEQDDQRPSDRLRKMLGWAAAAAAFPA
jgi:hypothetical protein